VIRILNSSTPNRWGQPYWAALSFCLILKHRAILSLSLLISAPFVRFFTERGHSTDPFFIIPVFL
jgi:uncharacterized metal-binding protein